MKQSNNKAPKTFRLKRSTGYLGQLRNYQHFINNKNYNVIQLLYFIIQVVKAICKVMVKVKVKCTLVQALRLCTDRTENRGSRGLALLFHDHGTRRT